MFKGHKTISTEYIEVNVQKKTTISDKSVNKLVRSTK